jgi:hypothetical protein
MARPHTMLGSTRYEYRQRTFPLEWPHADVQALSISVQDNPANVRDPYAFDITFECLEQLSKGTCHYPF